MSQPAKGLDKQLRAALIVATAALALFYLWPRDAPGPGPAGSASAASSAAPSRARAPWRRVHVGSGARTPFELSGAQAVAAEGIGALSGTVLSAADGRPIAGARLSFHAGSLFTTVSDDGGKFVLRPPSAGLYELSLVEKKGFVPFAPEWGRTPLVFVAAERRGLRGVLIYLTPEVHYRVHVQDDAGAAIEGAEVRHLEGAAEGASLAGAAPVERTDVDGDARLVAPDGAIVEAAAEGYAPGRAIVNIAAQIRGSLTIVLSRGTPPALSAITGRVLDADGHPAPEAVVGARFLAHNPASPAAQLIADHRTTADENGTFIIEDLESGHWELVASAPGLASATGRAEAGDRDVVLRLSGGGALFGRVTDAQSGKPLPAFSVIVLRAGGLADEVVHVESTFAPDGRYEITALPAGDYVVTAKAHARALAPRRNVTIVEGKDHEQDFTLGPGGKLIGTVIDTETRDPIEGARCSVEGYLAAETAVPLSAISRTDAQGRFELPGLTPGAVSIFVAAKGHHARVIGGLELVEGETRGIEVALTPLEKGEEPRIELAGIGAVLAVKNDVLMIGRVLEGGGAAEVGLAPDDAILAVDGQPVTDLGFAGAIERIRGPEGTSVLLRVQRSSSAEPEDLLVPRRRVRG